MTSSNFEFCRFYVKGKSKSNNDKYLKNYIDIQKKLPFFEIMLNTFNQRASMGSTDALSIIYRDIIITLFYDVLIKVQSNLLICSVDMFNTRRNLNYVLESIVEEYKWGEVF